MSLARSYARFAAQARVGPARSFAAKSDPGAVRIDLEGCFKTHRAFRRRFPTPRAGDNVQNKRRVSVNTTLPASLPRLR